ncbi:MAG TPA: hypothetical protein PLD47_05865 [Aggregatilineales bacterium]|nr:hypothetical protein [Anaerolineales bacterium]HRE47234.1 hypothetical protein [Aggregatilineales bacterium]
MRETQGHSFWWGVLILLLLGGGFAFLLRGVVDFVETGGDFPTLTPELPAITLTEAPTLRSLNYIFTTPTPQPACLEFYVTVVRARVRKCPSEECETLERPYQYAKFCVWGRSLTAPEWYEINLDPGEPIPRVGYMHESVIYPSQPTKTPTRTPRPAPLSTVTRIP